MNQEELKQRLIALLIKSFDEQYEKRRLLTAPHTAEALIANGVTIRERGEWELYGNDDDLGLSFFCSLCGWNIDEDMFYRSQTNDYKMYKYCPHCGADMRGVTETEKGGAE